jgi:hypothetical protein
MDIFDESSSLSNFSPSELFGNSYILYGLALLILVVGSYFVYKYYFNKSNLSDSTNIDYLGTYENNQNDGNNEQQYVDNEQNNNEN